MKKQLFLSIATLFIFLFMFNYVSGVGTYPAVDSDMVLYYHINNQSEYGENDTHVYDFSNSHLFNATVMGGALFNTTGGYLRDGSFEFDGNTNNKAIRHLNREIDATRGTISFWFIRRGPLVSYWLFSYVNSTYTDSYEMTWSGTNKLTLGAEIGNVQQIGTTGLTSATTLTANTWYYTTVVYNGTDTLLYLNGNLENSTSGGVFLKNISMTTSDLLLGIRNDNTADFNGSIDDFVVYNRSLTSQEIKDNYNYYVEECGRNPTDGCSYSESAVMNKLTYYLNGSGSSSEAMDITASNLVIDCNGSTFISNSTTWSSGTGNTAFRSYNNNNVTLKNCNFENYNVPITLKFIDGLYIYNSTFRNSYYHIYIFDDVNNTIIENNTFFNVSFSSIFTSAPPGYDRTGISILNNNFSEQCDRTIRISRHSTQKDIRNVIVKNNYVYSTCAFNSMIPFKFDGVDGAVIENNSFYGDSGGSQIDIAIQLGTTNNTNISHNYIYDYVWGIEATGVSTNYNNNLRIFNNTHQLNDIAVFLKLVRGFNIYDNQFINSTNNLDAYDSSIVLSNSSNGNIFRNNFSEVATYGIWGTVVNGINISSNTFDSIPLSSRGSYQANDRGDVPSAIAIAQMYKSIPQINDSGQPNNITFVGTLDSDNITISDNTYDSDTQVYLLLQGVSNVTHDTLNYWYVKTQPHINLQDPIEYFISNNFNNLSSQSIVSGYAQYFNGFSSYIRYTYRNRGDLVAQITKNHEIYTNVNNTQNYTISIFNKSNSLIYFSNNSVACSNINSCDGNINITLPPNNSSYVLDNFNLTEGVSREYSPMTVVGTETSNSKSYIINSTLADTVNGTTVRIKKNLRACTDFTSASLSANSGKYNKTYAVGDWTCDGTYLTFTVDELATGTNNYINLSMVNPGVGNSHDGSNALTNLSFNQTNDTLNANEAAVSQLTEDINEFVDKISYWIQRNFMILLIVLVVFLGLAGARRSIVVKRR